MVIGVPKEIKQGEYRVAIVPAIVESLVKNGHEVLIEAEAGRGSGVSDAAYKEAGAKIIERPQDVFASADRS